MKKLAVISLIILVTCSISFPLDASGLWFGGIFSQGFNLINIFHPSKVNNEDDENVIERQFKVAMGKKLNMELLIGGTINIKGWDKEELSAKVYLEGEDAGQCKVDFEESSDGIKIIAEYEGEKKNRISTDLTFEIMLPRRFDINLDTMGGGISVENVEGEISGETKGGELSLNNLKGNLNLRTMGGAIELTNSEVDGSVTTMGGNVTIKDVKGDIKGKSMGGNVTYSNVTRRSGDEMGKEVNISSMGGEISVDNAPNGANVSTMGGDIKVGSVKQYLKAKTMGGDINIGEADGRVDATTMHGDISAKLLGDANSTGRDVKLSSMSGEITLYVPPDLSMDVEINIAHSKDRKNGAKIISDFDLNISEKDNEREGNWHGYSGKRLEGKGSFNGGKNRIKINTVNGNVYLKKL